MASETLIHWNAKAKVLKYSPQQVDLSRNILGHEPDAVELAVHHAEPADGIAEDEGNVLCTFGLAKITSLITGGGAQAGTVAQSLLGVGTGSPTCAAADTQLSVNVAGSSWYNLVDSSGISVSNGVITITSTFIGANGNFVWGEWGWVVTTGTAASAATFAATGTVPVLMNHKTTALGTKGSGSSWVFVATITLT